MTKARHTGEGWLAYYIGRDGKWVTATDARGFPIVCSSQELAELVAAHRRSRLEPF